MGCQHDLPRIPLQGIFGSLREQLTRACESDQAAGGHHCHLTLATAGLQQEPMTTAASSMVGALVCGQSPVAVLDQTKDTLLLTELFMVPGFCQPGLKPPGMNWSIT